MSKEIMTIEEAYTCPKCGGTAIQVCSMEQIFDDARVEEVACRNCNSAWKVYYKMADIRTKLINITDAPTPSVDGNTVPSVINGELVDVPAVDLNNADEVAAVEEGIDNATYSE